MSKILVAMSGGVDSTVTALMLKRAGHDVAGATAKFFSRDGSGRFVFDTPLSEDEAKDARHAAERIGIEWSLIDLRREFARDVLYPFTEIYRAGGTPNPCIMCNTSMKFGALLDYAVKGGYDKLATGHYAEICEDGGRMHLRRAQNRAKDQSYFLYNLTQYQLSHALFPLGNMSKEETRAAAREAGLDNAEKKDSQDICFVADGNYLHVLKAITGDDSPHGKFVDIHGNILGEHKGIAAYTVGQRKGLGISFNSPMYVREKRAEDNTVVLCTNEELYSYTLTAHAYNEILPFYGIKRYEVKIRSTGDAVPATAERIAADRIKVTFDDAQRAAARGQAVVLYDGDEVIGGGVID